MSMIVCDLSVDMIDRIQMNQMWQVMIVFGFNFLLKTKQKVYKIITSS